MIDGRPAVAGSQLIEADGVNVIRIHPSVRFAAPAEAHLVAHVAARRLPHIAQAQPAAGQLPLAAVRADDLREDSVIVADAIADGRIVQRGQ